jgi:hypothetical protein
MQPLKQNFKQPKNPQKTPAKNLPKTLSKNPTAKNLVRRIAVPKIFYDNINKNLAKNL